MIAFVVHGGRTHHPRVRELRALCEADGELRTAVWSTTRHAGHAIGLASQAVLEGATIIVAVGGDGTVNEVANGIANSGATGDDVLMSIFPVGSGNDCARTLGLTQSATQCVALLKGPDVRSRAVDLLSIRYTALPGCVPQTTERLCMNVADAGLGGMVAGLVARTPSWWNADVRYFLSGLVGMMRFAKHRTRVEWSETAEGLGNHPDRPSEHHRANPPRQREHERDISPSDHAPTHAWEGSAMSVCFANFTTFGGGIIIAPHADASDGRIALTVIGDVSLLDYLRWMPALRAGDRIRHPQVRYAQAAHVRVACDDPLYVEIDGEVVGTTPVEVRVVPQRLRVIA